MVAVYRGVITAALAGCQQRNTDGGYAHQEK